MQVSGPGSVKLLVEVLQVIVAVTLVPSVVSAGFTFTTVDVSPWLRLPVAPWQGPVVESGQYFWRVLQLMRLQLLAVGPDHTPTPPTLLQVKVAAPDHEAVLKATLESWPT